MNTAIAVVGLACRYPDAGSPQDLWENVLAKRRAFRRLPEERLSSADYFSADPSMPDAIYSWHAAVIEGYEFDRSRFKVAGNSYRAADLTHWLALDVADQALRDAGFPDGEGLPRQSTGVLVGNTLTGEFSRAALMRLRWPYVRRVVDKQLADEGWDGARRRSFLEALEDSYKAPFPEIDEDTLAGGLSNTISGRICNYFHLGGGGYTVDGACSSSLLAVAHGCTALATGDLDVAVAGGVDLSLDPFELVGFCKAGALSRTHMRVYDRDADGFWPGEGCGIAVLMRQEDALARGLRCYALIRGWGISSDGGGGITRPEIDGQRLAIERAYRRAGFGPDTVELFEGHGTGTALGDEVELRALAQARRDARCRAAIGSIKANIGHTKAAAGAAGLIKATMALHAQIIPPNTGLEKPRPELEEGGPFRAVHCAQPWPADRPLRTGVSAFGFGGINVHLALEGASAARRAALTIREHVLASSAQDTEIFLIGAADRAALLERLRRLAGIAARLSYAELGDLAAALTEWSGPQRAALVAASPAQLQSGLDTLIEWLQCGDERRLDAGAGLFAGRALEPPRIAFLFPGQAAPVYPEGGALARRFGAAREIYARAALPAGGSATTAIAQPAIIAAELAALRILGQFGIEAEIAVGHSVGEIAALHWAGALSAEAALELARERGRLMNDVPGPAGAMVSVAAAAASVARMLAGNVAIACYNAERHTVLSGESRAVGEVADRCRAAGMHVTPLPVSHAFHSPLMAPAARPLREYLAQVELRSLQRRVVSTITGADLDPSEDLRALLVRQLTEPVKFEQATTALAGAQLCIEVGPGAVLTNLVRMASPVPVVALDAGGSSLGGLLRAIAASFALGAPVDCKAVFSGRLTRPFALDWRPRFFASPCELAPPSRDAPTARTPRPAEPPVQAVALEAAAEPLELVRGLVAARAELPLSAISNDSRLLMDLHLNSLAVGQLVAAAARALGLAPPVSLLDYADATVGEIATALAERRAVGVTAASEPERHPAGVDAWVRAFVVEDVECPLPVLTGTRTGGGPWRIFAAEHDPLARRISQSLTADRGPGVLVCIGEERGAIAISRLLQAARCALEVGGRFVLVNHGGACGASLARTLHFEAPALAVCVVDTPPDTAAAGRVLTEIDAGTGYREARYDTAGRRSERRLQVLPLSPGSGSLPLGSDDILLVTGGGKGIGAECALALARESGVRLAIVGRSDPQSDRELEGNLRRLSDAGIVWRYYRADVADLEALGAVVAQVGVELGPVTSLLHAAGANRPALLRELDAAKVHATFSPKVDGLRNLFATLREQPLRLLVTFGSIIARIGMRGEADYALANEALAALVQQYADGHPDCRCLNLEWSVWSGAGMGERLGRVDAMLAEGIAPIPIDAGVAWLRHLVANPPGPVCVIVAGRFGETPTLRLEKPELPFLRFVERTRIFYPGIELVVEAELTPVSDPYLDDHVVGGERLFPAVMGLEAMAQVAMAVLGRTDRPGFDLIEFSHAITVAADHPETLRIAALVRGPAEVEVVLRCGSNAFQVDHFRARCRFGEGMREHARPEPPRAAAALVRGRDLYGNLFFHGGRFRRVHAYRHLSATECSAEIAIPDATAWFGRYLPADLVLGDPGLRDAALHSIQACIPHVRVLPVAVERIRSAAIDAPGPWIVSAKERSHDAGHYIYDFDLVAADGRISERWEGIKLRRVGPLKLQTWPTALLVPYLERRVRELLPGAQFAAALDDATFGTRRERSERAMLSALGHKARIRYRADGKPEINGASHLSAAHAGDITLAVAGTRRVACDIEWIDARRGTIRGDLLGPERQALADAIAAQAHEEASAAAVRIWSALECLKKAGAGPGTALSLAACERDGWVVLNAGDMGIATCITALGDPSAQAVVAILAEHPQSCAHMNTGT